MKRFAGPALVALIVCGINSIPLDAAPLDGTWELTHYQGLESGNYDAVYWILELRELDGKLQVRVVSESSMVKDHACEVVQWDKGRLRLKFTPPKEPFPMSPGQMNYHFDGVLAKNAEDGILGCIENFNRFYPAQMRLTKRTAIGKIGGGRTSVEIMEGPNKILKNLDRLPDKLRGKGRTPSQEAYETLYPQGFAMIDVTIPQLEEVLDKHPAHPAAAEAADFLVRQGVRRSQQQERVEKWARAGEKVARRYRPRFHAEYAMRLAAHLPVTKEYAPLILDLIKEIEEDLPMLDSLPLQCRTVWLKDAALRARGDAQGCAALDTDVKKLSDKLLAAYHADMPMPRITRFEGKIADGQVAVVEWLSENRVVGPAHKAALNAMAESYPAGKLILLQFPSFGPMIVPYGDPIGLQRFLAYERSLTREEKLTTPAQPFFVNGTSDKKFDHLKLTSQEIYDALRARIDKALSMPAKVQLEARVTRKGDDVAIQLKANKTPPGASLRVLLIERHGHYGMPTSTLTQTRIIRASHIAELAMEQTVPFNLGAVDRELTPTYVGGHPWEVAHAGAFNVVRERRWNGLYAVVLVEHGIFGPVLHAAQLDIPD
jgi:hypothetical protein